MEVTLYDFFKRMKDKPKGYKGMAITVKEIECKDPEFNHDDYTIDYQVEINGNIVKEDTTTINVFRGYDLEDTTDRIEYKFQVENVLDDMVYGQHPYLENLFDDIFE